MPSSLAVVAVLACVLSSAVAYDCSGKPNTLPIFSDPPVFVSKVPNGALYKVGDTQHNMSVVHLYGTPYQLGYAHGSLIKDEVDDLYKQFFAYLAAEVDAEIKFLPKQLREIIETKGVNGALDLMYNLTKNHTPPHFFEELQGLADGAGLDLQTVIRVHMFPELIRAGCSMLGAWGPATQNSSLAGGLLQLRALDWGTDNPMRFFPALLVYHPDEGQPFSILSWKGFVGAITGYSQHTGISEKKWYVDAPLEILPHGVPWHFLLRDILQFDAGLTSAIDRIVAARKTASIFVGVGSNAQKQFRAVEYGIDTARVFDDASPFPGYAPTPAQHPLMKGLVYIDPHTQPSDHPCMGEVLQAKYGQLDALAALELVSLLQSGDIHLAIYDYAANHVYASVASMTTPTVNAYDNYFFKFDMTPLFALPPPTM